MYDGRTLKDIVEWDVRTWKPALSWWDECAPDLKGARVLEIALAGVSSAPMSSGVEQVGQLVRIWL